MREEDICPNVSATELSGNASAKRGSQGAVRGDEDSVIDYPLARGYILGMAAI